MAKKTNTTTPASIDNSQLLELLSKVASSVETLASRMATLETKTASIGVNTRTAEPRKATTEELVRMAVLKHSDSQAFMYIRDKVMIAGNHVDPKGWNRTAMDACIYAHMLSLYKANTKSSKEAPDTIVVNLDGCKSQAEADERIMGSTGYPTPNTFTCDKCKFKPNCKKIAEDRVETCYHIRKAKSETVQPKADKKQAETVKVELTGRQLEVYNMLRSGMDKASIETALGVTVHGTIYSLKKKGYSWK